jgi:integrase
MLSADVDRYIALRQALGFTLRDTSSQLRAFAGFAESKGDRFLHVSTAVSWADEAPSSYARFIRLRRVVQFARFVRAEEPRHEVPDLGAFHVATVRQPPYIYSPEEVVRLMEAAGRLRRMYPLRRDGYATLIGLIAATGLRLSEALELRLDDVSVEGVLHIRRTKFGKSRFVPLHPTAHAALRRYLARRRRVTATTNHVFLSVKQRRLSSRTVHCTFRHLVRAAVISAAGRQRQPRIHDLRHTFATRALQQCAIRRDAVARHGVALATYLGHADIAHTYWYLEATPDLMVDIAAAAEQWVRREAV